jgi:aspartokinase
MVATSEERSVASSVKEVVLYHPSLSDCLVMDLLNYSAAADYLKNEVEKSLRKKGVSSDAIKMALIRLREDIRKEPTVISETKVIDIIRKSKLELKNEIVVLTVGTDSFRDNMMEVVQAMDKSRFMQLTQGISSVTIALDSDLYERLKGIFERSDTKDVMLDQSAIIILSPGEIIETAGVISYIVSSLAKRGVNITQIMSCYTDTILIVDRKQALEAYSLLENSILGIRQLGY